MAKNVQVFSQNNAPEKTVKNYEEYKKMVAKGEIVPMGPVHLLDRTFEFDAGGRPPKYETGEQLGESIMAYLQTGGRKKDVVVGQGATRKVVQIPVFTITGMALFLGFTDIHSMYDLENDERFASYIKKARTFITQVYEEQLQTNNPTGAIFALKNFGWSDRVEMDITQHTTINDVLNDIDKKDVIEGQIVSPADLLADPSVEIKIDEGGVAH